MVRINISSFSFGAFITSLAVFFLAYFSLQDDLKRLGLFGALIIVFYIFKFDSRIPIFYAILLLLIAALLTSQNVNDSADQLAILSYWFLVVGIVCTLIDLYRKPQTIARSVL